MLKHRPTDHFHTYMPPDAFSIWTHQTAQQGAESNGYRVTGLSGVSELYFTFKLPHSRSCVRELCVSAEVSPHALASMIEKLHTKTSSRHALASLCLQCMRWPHFCSYCLCLLCSAGNGIRPGKKSWHGEGD